MHDLDPLNLRVQPEHARLAPAPADRAIPQLSSRLERDEFRSTGNERRIALDKSRSRYEKTSVSITIGPRDRTELTTRRPPGRPRPPPRRDPQSPSHRAAAADDRGAEPPRQAARDAHHGHPVRASMVRHKPTSPGWLLLAHDAVGRDRDRGPVTVLEMDRNVDGWTPGGTAGWSTSRSPREGAMSSSTRSSIR